MESNSIPFLSFHLIAVHCNVQNVIKESNFSNNNLAQI